MVLGLNESVSMQSMTLTIQALRVNTLTRRWFLDNLRREMVTSLLLGVACGLLVSAIVWFWRRDLNGAAVVGGGIAVSLVTACLFGFSVPSLLHWLKRPENRRGAGDAAAPSSSRSSSISPRVAASLMNGSALCFSEHSSLE